MDEREMFERWARDEGINVTRCAHSDDYAFPAARASWKSWQAARRTTPDGEAWISVDERRPENDQPVAFVVKAEKGSTNEHLNGRILGGTYHRDWGFSTPGIGFIASHWMPLPTAPTSDNGGAR
ncbi:DUF551 domain-containing protein [Burkholderia cepacia]|uniref:DUF551 domain-containing protein n=1 Tax=Burkholderia cepacia TaxID=292 RepID=UPI0009BD1DA5|nr:DUF551 domain-containing protein [Burkholderia cepacia]